MIVQIMVFHVVIPCRITLEWASKLSEDVGVSTFQIAVGLKCNCKYYVFILINIGIA